MARLARWESKGGAHYAELHEERPAGKEPYYHYKGSGAMGVLGAKSAVDAVNAMTPKLQPGYFHPDNAKSPMQLTDATDRVHALFKDRRIAPAEPAKPLSLDDVVPNV
jgi:hypothetical protein